MAKFIAHRIGDRRLLRHVIKWLKAGVMEEGKLARNEEGTPQGGSISPLPSNIFLHYALDLEWNNGESAMRTEMFSSCVMPMTL